MLERRIPLPRSTKPIKRTPLKRKSWRKGRMDHKADCPALIHWGDPDREDICTCSKRAKKPRRPRNRKDATYSERMSLLKEKIHALWSKVVRARDGHKCAMCGSTEGLNAHHWIIHSARSLATRFLVDNGVTLCYACHKFKVHLEADAITLDGIREYMQKFVSPERYEQIKFLGHTTVSWGLQKLEDIKTGLETELARYG